MAGIDNLIPNSERTPEERRANAKKAGEASGESRRRKKALKAGMTQLLAMRCTDADAIAELEALGFKDEEINNQAVMVVALYKRALKGDVQAIKLITEIAGDDPELKLKRERFAHEKKIDEKRYW